MLLITLLAALAVPPAQAQGWKKLMRAAAAAPGKAAACPRVDPVHAGGTQGYADELRAGLCFVSITPMDSTGLVYRNYGVFSDGMLMVFNSFGDGDDTAKFTGAREFYFFPRAGALRLAIDPAAPSVSVTMADGGVLAFDPATAQVRAVDRGSVTVAARVDPADKGGVEFPAYSGLMLDAGFRMGELPSGRPGAESVFRDANGRSCAVKNSEVYAYAGGDRSFKFDDAALKAFLKTRCPNL
ncbi:MAG: hypothetical protein HYV15_07510, partial [Elusimicrobia bacterium]|nr:hypothetical protein [Elusimicrobiota bacterium]